MPSAGEPYGLARHGAGDLLCGVSGGRPTAAALPGAVTTPVRRTGAMNGSGAVRGEARPA